MWKYICFTSEIHNVPHFDGTMTNKNKIAAMKNKNKKASIYILSGQSDKQDAGTTRQLSYISSAPLL
jgi:hypothetical protein